MSFKQMEGAWEKMENQRKYGHEGGLVGKAIADAAERQAQAMNEHFERMETQRRSEVASENTRDAASLLASFERSLAALESNFKATVRSRMAQIVEEATKLACNWCRSALPAGASVCAACRRDVSPETPDVTRERARNALADWSGAVGALVLHRDIQEEQLLQNAQQIIAVTGSSAGDQRRLQGKLESDIKQLEHMYTDALQRTNAELELRRRNLNDMKSGIEGMKLRAAMKSLVSGKLASASFWRRSNWGTRLDYTTTVNDTIREVFQLESTALAALCRQAGQTSSSETDAIAGAITDFPPPSAAVVMRLTAQHDAAWKRAVGGALVELAPPTVPRLGTTVDVQKHLGEIDRLPTYVRDHVTSVLDDACLFAFGSPNGTDRIKKDLGPDAVMSRFGSAELASQMDVEEIVLCINNLVGATAPSKLTLALGFAGCVGLAVCSSALGKDAGSLICVGVIPLAIWVVLRTNHDQGVINNFRSRLTTAENALAADMERVDAAWRARLLASPLAPTPAPAR